MTNLSPRERNIAIGTGVVLAAAVLFQFFVWPALQRIERANALIETHKLQRVGDEGTIANSTVARRNWKKIAGDRLLSDASAAEGQLLNRVRDAAQNAGLQVQSFKPDRSEKEKGFYRITLRVNATGNMSRMTRFLYALQTSNVPLRVTDLQIAARKEGTDDLAIQFGVATIFNAPPEPAKIASGAVSRESVQ